MDKLYSWQRFRQGFAAPFPAGVFRDGNCLIVSGCCRLCLDLGFIKQADLIRDDLLTASRIAPGQREV
jgi:hypothetical protein